MTEQETRTRYHHGDLRSAMLRATEQMVVELGPEAVSVRAVARRAGVSSGAPFHHFPTRKALMTALAEEATRRLRNQIEDAVVGLDPIGRLRAIGRAYLDWAIGNQGQFKVVSDRSLIDYSEPIQTDNAAIMALMAETLDLAIRQTGGTPLDTDRTLLAMRAMAYGLARMFVDGHLPRWGVDEGQARRQMEAVLDSFLRGLLTT